MRLEKLSDIKSDYDFEAPVLPAGISHVPGVSLKNTPVSSMDLNKHLAPEPEDTFLVRVSGESMIGLNINDGDILVVNRRDTPAEGKIVVAAVNGEMAVKTYREIDGQVYLYSANEKFLPIKIFHFMDFHIQGVVKHVIHRV